MIKVCTKEETPFNTVRGGKFELFAKDIREIVENKIEYCELVDMPYSKTVSTADLEYHARRVIINILCSIHRKQPEKIDFITIRKRNLEDGTHFYAEFKVKEWEKIIEDELSVQ